MNLSISKTFAKSFIFCYLLLAILGTTLITFFYYLYFNSGVNPIIYKGFIYLIINSLIDNIYSLLYLLWFYFKAPEFKQDKWIWMIIGLVYGKYSIILFLLTLFVCKYDTDTSLFEKFKKLIILLLFCIGLNYIYFTIVDKYLSTSFANGMYSGLSFNYYYLNFLFSILRILLNVFLIIMNIILALKMKKWLVEFGISHKRLWIIFTLFAGLFAVIFFFNLRLMDANKTEPQN